MAAKVCLSFDPIQKQGRVCGPRSGRKGEITFPAFLAVVRNDRAMRKHPGAGWGAQCGGVRAFVCLNRGLLEGRVSPSWGNHLTNCDNNC